MKLYRVVLSFFAVVALMGAQSRTVTVSWTPSVTSGILGYTISTGTSGAGPFTFAGCTGAVPGQTCVPGSTAATTAFQDSQPVGTTVFYQVVAVAASCTPTTPATQVCGSGIPLVASTTVQSQPGVSAVMLVIP